MCARLRHKVSGQQAEVRAGGPRPEKVTGWDDGVWRARGRQVGSPAKGRLQAGRVDAGTGGVPDEGRAGLEGRWEWGLGGEGSPVGDSRVLSRDGCPGRGQGVSSRGTWR